MTQCQGLPYGKFCRSQGFSTNVRRRLLHHFMKICRLKIRLVVHFLNLLKLGMVYVCQGCTLVPTLFNFFFSAEVSTWRTDYVEVGMDVLSHLSIVCRKLGGDRTAKSRLAIMKVTKSQFVDDLALYASTCEKLEHMTLGFLKRTSRWDLTVSVSKAKGMVSGDGLSVADIAPLQTDGEIEIVNNFTYRATLAH